MARNDPWAQFADAPNAGFVGGDAEIVSNGAQSQPLANAPAEQQAKTADPYGSFGDAPATLDNRGTQIQGGFSDELPAQAVSSMSPADQAEIVALAQNGASARDLERAAAAKGFTFNNADAVVAARDQTGRINPDVIYQLPKVADDGSLAAIGRGAADSILSGTLPKAGAAIGALEQSLAGKSSFGDAYDRILDSNNATIASDEDNHPWERVGGQILGGMVLPAGMEGVGLKAGTDVLRAGGTMSEARVAAKFAVRNRMAAVGGAYGAAHGAGSGDTLTDAATGAATESAIGFATGGLMGQGGRSAKADERVTNATSDAMDVLDAGKRQGVDVLPADVGGPATRRLTAAFAQTPGGAKPIINAAQQVSTQAQAARDRIASGVGQALDREAAGNTALAGAKSYISSSRQMVGGLYDAAEKAADGQKVTPTKALDALDRNIAELSETPGGAPGLAQLQGLRESLAAGDVSVTGLRNMRSVLRDQFIKDGLRGSDIERRVGQVLDAARDDVTTGLRDAGKGNAASLYTKADNAYRDRVATIDTVLKPLIGTRDAPKSGEAITKALTSDLQGNNARAVKFLHALPPEEQANTRASIIGALGRSADGRQNAAGDAFSLDAFLTHWNKMGETAKKAYFGLEARSALNDLATVASASKQAGAYANRSNTGGVVAGLATGATFTAGFPVLLATLGAQYGAGRLLAAPSIARWVARAPKNAPPPRAYIDRLTRIARAEPAIANEVLQLQQRLTEAFSSAPTRMAAQEPSNEVARGQGNTTDQQGQNEGVQP